MENEGNQFTMLWEQGVPGSNPGAPTKTSVSP